MNNPKKHIISILSALAVIALTGCSQDEPKSQPAPRPIGIVTSTGDLSRDQAPLPTDYRMWVTALYHFNNAGFYYLKNNEFVCDNAQGIWHSATEALYPFEGSLDILGYAAKNPAHQPILTLTPSVAATGISDNAFISRAKLDYTYSTNRLDGTDDILIANVEEGITCGDNEDRIVPLNFSHLLTCVRFTFNAKTVEAATFMYITGAELLNVRPSGAVTLTRSKGQPWAIDWTSLGGRKNIRQSFSKNPIYKAPLTDGVEFYLPPQESAPAEFIIYFKYRTEENNYTDEHPFCLASFPSPEKWEVGKRYSYKIDCNMLPHVEFQISFDNDDNGPLIDDWEIDPDVVL